MDGVVVVATKMVFVCVPLAAAFSVQSCGATTYIYTEMWIISLDVLACLLAGFGVHFCVGCC